MRYTYPAQRYALFIIWNNVNIGITVKNVVNIRGKKLEKGRGEREEKDKKREIENVGEKKTEEEWVGGQVGWKGKMEGGEKEDNIEENIKDKGEGESLISDSNYYKNV